MVKELMRGILPNFKTSIVYKSVKEGTQSFRITQQLLQSIWYKAKQLKNVNYISTETIKKYDPQLLTFLNINKPLDLVIAKKQIEKRN